MVDPKSRYEASRALMNTLPPIKEESFLSTSSDGTPRNVQRVQVNNRQILVQTLPPDARPSPVPTPIREREPVIPEEEDDGVDQVVADYLHYARYSATVPVKTEQWDHNETLYCTCCNERNSENIRRQHGLPPVKPAHTAAKEADDNEETSASPRSFDSPRSQRSLESPRQSWMTYQPLPYAQTYLNPEFNRPSVIQAYQNAMKGDDDSAKMRAQILESTSKYDQAMKKLKFTTQKLDANFDESHMSFS